MTPLPDDLSLDLVRAHTQVCDALRKPLCEADLLVIAARALRRAYAAEVLAVWQKGELSEGQAAALLGMKRDPVRVRILLEAMVERVSGWWKERA